MIYDTQIARLTEYAGPVEFLPDKRAVFNEISETRGTSFYYNLTLDIRPKNYKQVPTLFQKWSWN